MRRHIFALAYVGALIGLVLSPAVEIGVKAQQAIAEVVGPTDKIPRELDKTWSLFLMCNPDWVSADRSRDVETLYGRFRAFGDAIGKENLAVWFWKRKRTSEIRGWRKTSMSLEARSTAACWRRSRAKAHISWLRPRIRISLRFRAIEPSSISAAVTRPLWRSTQCTD